MVDGQYIPNLFIALEVRHDKTSYSCVLVIKELDNVQKVGRSAIFQKLSKILK